MFLRKKILNYQQFVRMPLIAHVPLVYHGWYSLTAVLNLYVPDAQKLSLQFLTTIIRAPWVSLLSLLWFVSIKFCFFLSCSYFRPEASKTVQSGLEAANTVFTTAMFMWGKQLWLLCHSECPTSAIQPAR
jgi:hypothetical protein